MSATVVVIANAADAVTPTLASLARADGVGRVVVVPWHIDAAHLRAAVTPPALLLDVPAFESAYDAAAAGALIACDETLVFAFAGVAFGAQSITAFAAASAESGIAVPLVIGVDRTVLEAGWEVEVEPGGLVLRPRLAGSALEAPGVLARTDVEVARLRCMAMRLDRYRAFDGFAPRLASAYADVDLALRLRREGFALRYAPEAAVVDAFPSRPSIDDPSTSSAERFARAWQTLPAKPDVAPAEPQAAKLTSIVMLSWNAHEYTRGALDSIRAYTNVPYEVVIVDNGSGPETVAWLRTLRDVRVIYNAENTGFAHGCNQGLAAARGEYVVLLNNDVIVTEHWLEDLIDAIERDPGVGVSAPRSNVVAGNQQIPVPYRDIGGMHRFAAERRATYRRQGYRTDRAIGLCLCIDRKVIERVGGIDERYGVGNFEDDDFSLRVRAAGFGIYVCDDVFIHHFGSATFKANSVDWTATMVGNWGKFAEKWGFDTAYPTQGYDSRPAIARGFDPVVHYQALPVVDETPPVEFAEKVQALPEEAEPAPQRALRLVALVRTERDWSEVAPIVRRYATTIPSGSDAALEIAAAGDLSAQVLGQRVGRALAKAGLDLETIPDVSIDDVSDVAAWLAERRHAAAHVVGVHRRPPAELSALPVLEDASPSGLRRLITAAPRVALAANGGRIHESG